MPSPTAIKQQPQAPVQVRYWSVGKKLCRKGSGGLDGHQFEHEPATHPCSKEDQQSPGLCWEKHCQQVKGGDLPRYFMLLRSHLGAGSSAGLCSTREIGSKSSAVL